MSLSDAFETPVVAMIDGAERTLKPLSVVDYLPWCDELAQEYRLRNTALIPTDLKSVDKMKLQSQIAAFEVTPDDIRPLIFRAKGTLRVLRASAVKAMTGKRIDEQQDLNGAVTKIDAWIGEKSAKEAEQLAMRLSGLFTTDEIADWYQIRQQTKQETTPPNAGAAPSAAKQ